MAEKSMLPDFPGKTTKGKVEHGPPNEADEAINRLMNENAFQRTQIRAAMLELSKSSSHVDGLSLIGSIRTILQNLQEAQKAKYAAWDKLKKLRRSAASSKNAELCDEIDKILECLK